MTDKKISEGVRWVTCVDKVGRCRKKVEKKTTDIDYEEQWWQHTASSESNIYDEQLRFHSPIRIQTSQQEYNDLTASDRRPSTPYSRNTLQSFSRGTQYYAFMWSTKHAGTSFAYSQDFLKFALQCYGQYENRSGYLAALAQLFQEYVISWHLTYTFLGRLRQGFSTGGNFRI